MISISGLAIRLGNFALKDIKLDVGDRECLTTVGPNGSGKTTLLECIAGLQRPQAGRITIGDVDVTRLPPEKRRIGYVPQDFVLFPHLTADRNVAFGLRNSSDGGLGEAKKIMHWLGVQDLIGRDVRTLSAGERQKVALARALAVHPMALLLDEPLSALDPLARDRLRRDLRNVLTEILHTLDLPVIYVTHDLSEAQIMSDQIAVMNNGRIEQVGSMDKVFDNPSSQFVAEFLGFNSFDGVVVSGKDGAAAVDAEGTIIQTAVSNIALGDNVTVVLKPQDISLSLKGEIMKNKWHHCQCNVIQGIVTEVCKTGSTAKILIDAGVQLRSEVSVDLLDELDIVVGRRIFAQFKASQAKLIPKHSAANYTGAQPTGE